jgi:hypothetical protein
MIRLSKELNRIYDSKGWKYNNTYKGYTLNTCMVKDDVSGTPLLSKDFLIAYWYNYKREFRYKVVQDWNIDTIDHKFLPQQTEYAVVYDKKQKYLKQLGYMKTARGKVSGGDIKLHNDYQHTGGIRKYSFNKLMYYFYSYSLTYGNKIPIAILNLSDFSKEFQDIIMDFKKYEP